MNVLPVLLKEFRSQMRGRRAMIVLTVYLSILLLVALAIWAIAADAPSGTYAPEVGESIGKGLFIGLTILQAGLVILLAPAFTANAISGEREQKTFDVLAVTLVEPVWIVAGKLVASLAYLAMVLVASAPIVSLAFLFGGVEPTAVAAVFGVQLLLALVFGSLGLFFSSFVRRTLHSTVFSYVAIFVLVFVTPLVDAAISTMLDRADFLPLLSYLNPAPLVLSVAFPEFAAQVAKGNVPFTTLTPLLLLMAAAGMLAAAVFFVAPRRARRSR